MQVAKNSILFFILFSLVLTGCSTEPDNTIETVVEESSETVVKPIIEPAGVDIAVATELEKPPLDLSLPENIWAGDEGIHEPVNLPPKGFDASELFNQEEEDNLSFMVMPSFEINEDPTQLPQLDGGSVSMEMKTK
jgi:hypothetical protein